MHPAASHIAQLYYRLQAGLLTEEERQEWNAFVSAYPVEAEYILQLENEDDLATLFAQRSPATVDAIRERMLADIHQRIFRQSIENISSVVPDAPVHRIHFLRRGFLKYAAAIIILFGIGAYLWNHYTPTEKSTTADLTPFSHDILPGGQKAVLTLADGRKIILDNAKNGQLASEHGSDIIKRDGEIIYDAGQLRSEAVVYNTMSTPRGGQYQLTLPDGTKVWLNAASKIIYPANFTNRTREVNVTGEVYFEVAKNKSAPFVVHTKEESITVLGTSFNVNRYMDEPQGKISLMDGAIQVNNQLLQPGQAYVNGKVVNTNIEQDVAWKNGAFNFENMDLPTAFRLLGRWYDVEIKYAGKIPSKKMRGELGRDLTLSEVLNVLAKVGFHTRIVGRTLVVLPE